MHYRKVALGFLFLFGLATLSALAYSAPPCKGPNKYDPGCPDAAEPPPDPVVAPLVVDNATVDWFNQKIIIRGSGLSGATDFILGSTTLITKTTISDSIVELAFDNVVAGAVDLAGNYVLKVDGVSVLSLFFESQVVDPIATGCPCNTPWPVQLGPLWGLNTTQCLEIPGAGTNDQADIAGTILSDPDDPAVYPHYPIGAAFIPGDPVSSVCRLVQVDADSSVSDLVNIRINEAQQSNCAATLHANVCADP